MKMSIEHRELVKKAEDYLKGLVSDATDVTFEEFHPALAYENIPNAVVVVLSYTDPKKKDGLQAMFFRKLKSIYIDPSTGKLLAVKNKIG